MVVDEDLAVAGANKNLCARLLARLLPPNHACLGNFDWVLRAIEESQRITILVFQPFKLRRSPRLAN